LIFGLSVFAEPTFADLGDEVILDTGWLEVIKDPCDKSMWVKQDINYAEASKVDKQPSNWTVIK
jgi:hypothetical protein